MLTPVLLLIQFATTQNKELGTAFFNLGRVLFHLKRYSEAEGTLNMALEIRQKALPVDKPALQKTQSAIAECEAQISMKKEPTCQQKF